MRCEPHVDRQHPEHAQKLHDAGFGAEGQRDDQHVDMRKPRELDQFRHVAELGIAGNHVRRALRIAVVEDAADADVVFRLLFQCADQVLGRLAAADNDGTPFHHAVAPPAADGKADQVALDDKKGAAGSEPDGQRAWVSGVQVAEKQGGERGERKRPPSN